MPLSQDNNKTFSSPPTKDELLTEYCKNELLDPSSINYKRVLVRPKINFIKAGLYVLLSLIITSLIGLAVYFIFDSVLYAVLSSIIFLFIIILIFLKQIIIWIIRIYQRFASEERRMRCRFEPSCSNYMIIALEKYGLVRGLKKGISRLRRCRPPNGGYDYP